MARLDWETMTHAAQNLDALGVPHETRVFQRIALPICSSHMRRKQKSAASKSSSREQAVLPSARNGRIGKPCCGFGVPVESKALKGLDSLLSIGQMPANSRRNAHDRQGWRDECTLLAAASLGNKYPKIRSAQKIPCIHKPKKFWQFPIRQNSLPFRAQKREAQVTIDSCGWPVGYMLALAGYPLDFPLSFSRSIAAGPCGPHCATRLRRIHGFEDSKNSRTASRSSYEFEMFRRSGAFSSKN